MTDKKIRDDFDILTACALRFNGYNYFQACMPKNDDRALVDLYQKFLRSPDYTKSTEFLRLIFFLIQRWHLRDGMPRTNDHELRVARTIFLQTCSYPVSPQYQERSDCHRWDTEYLPQLPELIEHVRAIHGRIEYRDYDGR